MKEEPKSNYQYYLEKARMYVATASAFAEGSEKLELERTFFFLNLLGRDNLERSAMREEKLGRMMQNLDEAYDFIWKSTRPTLDDIPLVPYYLDSAMGRLKDTMFLMETEMPSSWGHIKDDEYGFPRRRKTREEMD